MVQQNLNTILERGAISINNENQLEEHEQVTCTGNIIKKQPKAGVLFYYKKAKLPETYEDPSMGQFQDFMSIPTLDKSKVNTADVTYEQFCEMSKKSFEEAQENGFGLAVQSRFCEFMDDASLEKIKEEIRQEEGFIGFPEDPIIDELTTPIATMIERWK